MTLENEAARIAAGLTQIERDWFLEKGWQAWTYAVGCDLVAKGLTAKSGGSIFLTPLGHAVRKVLQDD